MKARRKLPQAKEKIFKYYDMLKKGTPFVEVARNYSEDAGTAKNGGQMRWLKSGELPPDIEETVFALKDSDDYTRSPAIRLWMAYFPASAKASCGIL